MMTVTNEQVRPYERAAIYAFDSDCVEYVRSDCFCFHERVDEYLTLIHDESGDNVIGFKLKGFKHIFQQMKALLDLTDSMFVSLVKALERLVYQIGESVLGDANLRAAYKSALNLASNDNVRFDVAEMIAA